METIYVVQGFMAGKRGALVPMTPVTFKTESQARSRAARLGETCQGVIAFSQAADVDSGDYADPVVLETHGNVPEMG